jgi:hypothetical protein
MRRQPFLTVAFLLSVSGTAVADMGPPPGYSRVPRDLVLEVESEFPGYRFWLVSPRGAEPLDLAPGRPLRVDGGGRDGSHRIAYVIAAPVGLIESLKVTPAEQDFWSGKLPPSVLWSEKLDFYARAPFYDSRERVIDRYRVEFAPGQPVRLMWLGQNESSPWVKGAWAAAGLFAFAAVVRAAIWLLRKSAKKQPLA